MMFQRRPFISQREKALALRDAGQSRHRRDPEAARPASADGARGVRSTRKPYGDGTVAVRHKVGTIAGTMAVSLAFFSGTASAHTTSCNHRAASYVEPVIGQGPCT